MNEIKLLALDLLLIVALVLLGLNDLQTHRALSRSNTALGHSQEQLKGVQLDYAIARADAASAALAADQRYRTLERQMGLAAKEKEDALVQEKARNDRLLAAADRTDAGVRQSLAAWSAAADRAAGDAAAGAAALAECRARTAAAGALLADGLRLQDQLAAAAEGHAAEVRALLGWGRALSCGAG
jgi:hypothetical protein